MKMLAFAERTAKEIVRDPINLMFGLGFPVVLLLLLTAIQSNVPVELFELKNITPGIAVFGFSFLSLFSATLISKDRISSFQSRLLTTPLKASDYILGYTFPMIPMAAAQLFLLYFTAFVLGMDFDSNVLYAMASAIPAALFFIGFGLLCGSVFNDKQVGGICGALLTNLTAWLSGTWFSLELVGGAFKKIAELLPFMHAVEAGRAVITGNSVGTHMIWVLVYMSVIFLTAIFAFSNKMKKA